jgi:hypothetical protein
MYLSYEARLVASPGPNTVKYENKIMPKYPAVVINNVIPIAMFRLLLWLPFNRDQTTKKNMHTKVQLKGVSEAEYDGFM